MKKILFIVLLLFTISAFPQAINLQKITDFPAAADADSGDVFPFVDISAGKTKKITRYDLFREIDSLITALQDTATALRLANNALMDSILVLRDLIQGDTTVIPPEVEFDYYVNSVSGNDESDGTTKATAWKTNSRVNRAALVPGDSVAYHGEMVYSDTGLAVRDGVTYTSYNGGRAIIRPEPLTNTKWTISAADASNVNINNLEIVSAYWFNAKGSTGINVDNCYFHFYDNTNNAYMPKSGIGSFYADYTDDLYLTITNSIFEGGFPQAAGECGVIQDSICTGDMFNFVSSGYIWLENNLIKNITHSLIATGNATHHLGLRHNRIYNQFHHGLFAYEGDEYSLQVDYNYFERSGNGKFGTNNLVLYNGELGSFGVEGDSSNYHNNVIRLSGAARSRWLYVPAVNMMINSDYNSFFNNTIDKSYAAIGMRIGLSEASTSLSNNNYFNNAFSRVGDSTWFTYYGVKADSVAIMIEDDATSYNPSNNIIDYNYFGALDSNIYNLGAGLANTNTTWTGITFVNNVSGNYSVFDSPDDSLLNYTYWTPETVRGNIFDSLNVNFNPSSALQDAGRHITQVNGNQTGTKIVVDNSRPFFSGWGWKDGDSICVTRISDGITKVYARIASIANSINTLVLEQSITVYDNDYVDIVNPITGEAYRNLGIDIGAFEKLP